MINPLERLQEFGSLGIDLVLQNKKIAAVTTTFMLAGGIAILGGGGGEIRQQTNGKENKNDKTPIPALFAKTPFLATPRVRSDAAEAEANSSNLVMVNGLSYSSLPGPDYPQGCSTNQITRNILTEQQLLRMGLKRGDLMYMKNNSGKGSSTAWTCQNGQRVPNPPPPLIPGRNTWH